MTSQVLGVDGVIRALANLERRAHGAARRAVGETTRQVQLGLRREVNSIFRKNARAGNAIRSVVYDNRTATTVRRSGRGRAFAIEGGAAHRSDAAGLVFSKFGRGRGAAYVDYLLPYITGAAILPRTARYLAIPLQPGKANRRPRAEMNLATVASGGRVYLVKKMARKTLFMFLLVPRARVHHRLRLAGLLATGSRTLTAAAIRAYRAGPAA